MKSTVVHWLVAVIPFRDLIYPGIPAPAGLFILLTPLLYVQPVGSNKHLF